jgi:hypothetical protein
MGVMTNILREHKVQGYQAERLLNAVLRFRHSWDRYTRPDDVEQLLRIFPDVTLSGGYVLDYLQMGGTQSGWIWPYARQAEKRGEEGVPKALVSIPRDCLVNLRGTSEMKSIGIRTLYRYLHYPPTPYGLLEYVLFVSELWALKSASKAEDWLDLMPVFTRTAFDRLLLKSTSVAKRIARPESYDPLVRLQPEGGGDVRFLVYQGGPWERIYHLVCSVDRDGYLRTQQGRVFVIL